MTRLWWMAGLRHDVKLEESREAEILNKTLLAGLLAMVLTFMSLEVHAQYVASINLSVSIPKIVRLETEAPGVQIEFLPEVVF